MQKHPVSLTFFYKNCKQDVAQENGALKRRLSPKSLSLKSELWTGVF